MFLLIVFFFFLMFLGNSVVFFWSVSLLLTFCTILIFYWQGMPFVVLFNYYLYQEVCGLLFLTMSGAQSQVVAVMLKAGVAPLHFWVSGVAKYLLGATLVWFLLWSKLPYIPLFGAFGETLYKVLFLGLLILYVQIFSIASLSLLMVFGSIESFSWMLLALTLCFLGYYHLFLVYFICMSTVLGGGDTYSYSDLLWGVFLMSLPVSALFWVKYFSLSLEDAVFLFLVFLLPASTISMGYFCFVFMLNNMGDSNMSLLYLPFFVFFLFYLV